jgi:hypothetical protein
MSPPAGRLRIVVLGYLVRGPLGGIAWHYLQYVLGLRRLGHDVFFFEDSDDYPSCYDPVRNVTDADPAYGLAFAARAFDRLGLGARWTYYDAHRRRWLGPAGAAARGICDTADVVVNVSSVNPLRSWMREIPTRILVDTDPGFTQIRHLTNPAARERASQHTAFVSFGENIGRPGCAIPHDGFPWAPTRQPIVLDAWIPADGHVRRPLSTVMQWDSYRAEEHEGTRYGMKGDSFAPYLDLPSRADDAFAIALGGSADVQARLSEHGWTILDSREPTVDPWTYQDFIRESKAEFSVAKHGYVVSRSGWFSERSAAYLASGRPVVVQDTGFTQWLHADGGVLPFVDPDDALARLDALNRSYAWHCAMAREVAQEYFDSTKVLSQLLESATAGVRGR